MNLSHQAVLQLMALADGELDGAEREHAEKLVAENDDARRIVEELRGAAASSWLGPAMVNRAAGADGIAASVMAKIDAGGVVSLADRRIARRSPRLPVVIGAATAALALAAGVAAYVHSGAARPGERAPVASVRIPPVDFQAPSPIAEQAGPIDGVEVNEIDAPARGVSVFEIPAGAAAAMASPSRASSVVVWVDEDPPESK
jgi:hypothetical protein